MQKSHKEWVGITGILSLLRVTAVIATILSTNGGHDPAPREAKMQSYSEPIEAGGHSASQLPFATQQEAIDKLKVTYNSFVIILLKMKNLLSRIVRYHSPPIPMSYTSFEKAFIRSTKNKPQMVVKKKKKKNSMSESLIAEILSSSSSSAGIRYNKMHHAPYTPSYQNSLNPFRMFRNLPLTILPSPKQYANMRPNCIIPQIFTDLRNRKSAV